MLNVKRPQQLSKPSFLQVINGARHEQTLWLYMIIVFGHWLEHLAQVYQVYIMGWVPAQAGGVLGLWFPRLAQAEILHFAYNSFLLGGLILLRYGFSGRSHRWWHIALIVQGWHFFEHTLLQIQWLTGSYLWGASIQTSILQHWFPRVELHFIYNLLVFIPMVVGMYYHFYQPAGEPVNTNCSCSRMQNLNIHGNAAGW